MRKNKRTKDVMIPIHISKGEVASFNFMQGGQFIDKETGLREYSRLVPIISDPEIRDLFVDLSDHYGHHRKLPKEALRIIHELEHTEHIDEFYEEIPSDRDPEIVKLERMGQGDDKKIVLMPNSIVNFMDAIQGKTRRSSKDGLQEFGFFHEILRGVATLGGAAFGGPFGAALGNMIGRIGTGAKLKDSLLPSAKIGLATWGAGKLAGMAGNAIPGMAKAAPSVFGENASFGQLPGFMTGATGAAGAAGATDAIPSWLIPAGLMGAGFMTKQKSEKQKEKYYRDMEKERRKEVEEARERSGFNTPLGVEFRKFPHSISGIESGKTEHFRKGGHIITGRPIVGKGKGQEDLIKDDGVKEGGWIWDASTVANMGDGSTKAGQKEIEKLETFISKVTPDIKKLKHLDHGGKPRMVPCALSDGERYTPPEIVSAAGDSSNTKGAEKFRAVTKFLRRHKISKGTDLPPAAPDIIKLFKKVG